MVRVKKTDEKEDEGMELSEEDIEALSQGTKVAVKYETKSTREHACTLCIEMT